MSEAAKLSRFAVTPGVGKVFLSPAQMEAIARTVGGEGSIEMNGFLQLILSMPSHRVLEAQERLRKAGLSIYPVGPVVKNLQTCTFCMGDRIDGLPDAQLLDQLVAGTPVPYPLRVGFSGCANNCGEAIMRDIGVVRKDGGLYEIYIGGRAGGQPVLGIKVGEGLSGSGMIESVRALVSTYRALAKGKERFWKIVSRLGPGPFQAALAALAPPP